MFGFRIAKKANPVGTITGAYDPEKQLWRKGQAGPHASQNWYYTDYEVQSTHSYYNTVWEYQTDDGVNPIHTDYDGGLDEDPDSDTEWKIDSEC